MVKTARWMGFAVCALLMSLSIFAYGQDPSQSIDSIRKGMEQKNLTFFVIKAPGSENNTFIGVQYLRGVAVSIVYAEVMQDCLITVAKDMGDQNYRKVFQDLTMVKGNHFTSVFDFKMDNLRTDSSSGDIIRTQDKICNLNVGYKENQFPNDQAYKSYVEQNRDNYARWLALIAAALK